MFTHHTSWPCGLGGKRDNESDDWNKVTCPGCLLKQPRSGDVVHYWPSGGESACGVDLWNTPYTFGASDWSDVTCGECKLEQPAQKVPGRVEYEIPAEVQHLDALLAATDRRERAARKVVKWTARLNAALTEERRLTDAPVQLLPAPAEVRVQHLNSYEHKGKAMCGAPFAIIPTGDPAQCSECEQLWTARRMQLAPFQLRTQELREQGTLSLREAQQAALNEAHERAIEIEWQAALDEAHGRALEIEWRREQVEQAYRDSRRGLLDDAQLKPFTQRVIQFCKNGLSLAAAEQAALDEAHEQAREIIWRRRGGKPMPY